KPRAVGRRRRRRSPVGRDGGLGCLGALGAVIAGNLVEVKLVADAAGRLGTGWTTAIPGAGPAVRVVHGLYLWLGERWPLAVPSEYWSGPATRAIPHASMEPPPITEFPFFTFLFADLHAHLLAMPYVGLAIAGAIHLVADGERPPRDGGRAAWPAETAVPRLPSP